MRRALLSVLLLATAFAVAAETATCPAPAEDLIRLEAKAEAASAVGETADPRPYNVAHSEVRDTMKRILAGPEFSPEEVRTVPRVKSKETKQPKDSDWLKSVQDFFRGLAEIARVVVWIFIAVAVVALLVGLHYWWRVSGPRLGSGKVDLPTSVAGLDIRPESLPDDIGAAARDAWRRGNAVEALSLLYRGALSALVLRFDVAIRASFTEQECLRAARKRLASGDVVEYFARLTQVWVFAVYAKRLPPDEAGLALCDAFNRSFAAPSAAPAAQSMRPAT
ncbi:MAG: DUF4129 domain-containing protein [Betaproteobacteria bacterium]|nr:DUF4129 domain-containing protein [Betaproteobacteria bacterium]